MKFLMWHLLCYLFCLGSISSRSNLKKKTKTLHNKNKNWTYYLNYFFSQDMWTMMKLQLICMVSENEMHFPYDVWLLSSLGEAVMNFTKLHRAKNTRKLIINNKYIKYLHSFIIFTSDFLLVTSYHLHNPIIILISIFTFLCLTPYVFTNCIRAQF